MSTASVMIAGVGGQGTLLASKVLGAALLSLNYDVKVSEVHGMSQRGGSVVTYVRFGEVVHAPIVDVGEADFLLAFEPLEAARYLSRLKPEGLLIVNTASTLPMPVITGQMAYPEDVIGKLRARMNTVAIDALTLAQSAGSAKAVNMVLMGALAARMRIPASAWSDALEKQVPARFLELNRRAFELGNAY